MKTFRYFAYGSNMLSARLRRRCASAQLVTVARAAGHSVTFDKRSSDVSGKATLTRTATTEAALGVVFEISAHHSAALDRAEPGYDRLERFPVTCLRSGRAISTRTYVGRDPSPGLRPYDWYLALLMAGVAEHGLAREYASTFLGAGFEVDRERSRQARQEAVRALVEAGFADYSELLTAGVR